MMAQVYSEEFHEFIETYGELLDQVESARDELDAVQEDVSSRLYDLSGELEETMKLLQSLEKQVWQFRSRIDTKEPIVKEQRQPGEETALAFMPDQANEEDPFADIWKS